MKRIFILPVLPFLFLLLICAGVQAANYFVDAEHGKDSNAGTSPETAWQTLKNVNVQKFLPGDTIAFRAGQVWRGRVNCKVSGEPGKPITYTSYGEGAKPEFWGSVDLTKKEFWKLHSPGIWVTLPDEVKLQGDYQEFQTAKWHSYTEGKAKTRWYAQKDAENRNVYSIQCLEVTDRACDVQLSASVFQVQPETALTFRCLVRLTEMNPETEAASEMLSGAFVPKGENLMDEAKGKEFAKVLSFMQNGKPWGGYGSVVQSSVKPGKEWTEISVTVKTSVTQIQNDGRISFFVGPQLPKNSVLSIIPLEMRKAEVESVGFFHDAGNLIMRRKDAPKDSEVTCGWKRWDVESLKNEGDFFHDLASNQLYFKSEKNPAEVYSMLEAACRCNLFDWNQQEYIVVEGLAFAYSGGHGLRGGPNCRHCIARGNDFRWIGGSWLYTRPGQIPTRYGNGIEFWEGNEDLLIENNYFYQIYDTAMTNQGPGEGVLKDMVWRGNRCEKCEQCYEIWFGSPELFVESLTVEKNDFRNSGFGWSHEQRPDKRAAHFLAYGFNAKVGKISYTDNYLGNSLMHMLWFYNSRLSEFKFDRNTYVQNCENVQDAKLFYWGGQPKEGVTFEEYRRLTGNDKNSLLENKKTF